MWDVQTPLQQCIEEYLSDLSVGSDDEGPTARSAPPKVTAPQPRLMRQTAGKMSASRAAATVAATQAAESKKKKKRKRKRAGPTVSVHTTTASSDVEIINIKEEKDDVKSLSTSTEQATETPRKAIVVEECSRSGADVPGDAVSQKSAKKAPPKTIKPGLRSTSK